MRILIAGLVMALAASAASASEITIPLPAGTEVETIAASYTCDDSSIEVTYINAAGISLAVLNLGEETIVASNVLSGSGARYAGAQYIWWTKGDDASLYNLMDGGEEKPAATCSVVN